MSTYSKAGDSRTNADGSISTLVDNGDGTLGTLTKGCPPTPPVYLHLDGVIRGWPEKPEVITSQLTRHALDWAVAQCEGFVTDTYMKGIDIKLAVDGKCSCLLAPIDRDYVRWSPSSNWAQGGPIIDRAHISVVRGNPLYFPKGNEAGDHYEPLWLASRGSGLQFHGRTALEAAMRCYVHSILGSAVCVPAVLADVPR